MPAGLLLPAPVLLATAPVAAGEDEAAGTTLKLLTKILVSCADRGWEEYACAGSSEPRRA